MLGNNIAMYLLPVLLDNFLSAVRFCHCTIYTRSRTSYLLPVLPLQFLSAVRSQYTVRSTHSAIYIRKISLCSISGPIAANVQWLGYKGQGRRFKSHSGHKVQFIAMCLGLQYNKLIYIVCIYINGMLLKFFLNTFNNADSS